MNKTKNMETSNKEVIRLEHIRRDFHVGDEVVHALRDVSFTILEGEFVTIMGTSGSGKSTLLNTLGCLDTPTSGEYYLDGVAVRTMDKNQRATLRNRKIGFVFQNYNLLPKTTAIENVELPLMYNPSCSAAERYRRSVEALRAVGLGDRLLHRSNQMSGGQMQRVAIARALVNNPAVILADEATGNLDTRTSFEVLVLFQQLHAAGRTIIFVTHNPDIARYSSRNITLRDGRITGDVRNDRILSAPNCCANTSANAARRPTAPSASTYRSCTATPPSSYRSSSTNGSPWSSPRREIRPPGPRGCTMPGARSPTWSRARDSPAKARLRGSMPS